MAEVDFAPLSSDVLCRALRAKTYSKQQWDQQNWTPGSLMTISIPSLPQFWVPSASWFEFNLSVGYTTNNLDAVLTPPGVNSGKILVSQFFPHSACVRTNVLSSNGQTISNIQNYAQIHMAKVLLCGMDSNVSRMNLMNVNPTWQPYAASSSAASRQSPYQMGAYLGGDPTSQNLVPNGTGVCNMTVNTQMGMLPIFQLDALIDLASMASQTRSSLQLQMQMDVQANWLATNITGASTTGGTGTGAPTISLGTVLIQPFYYMCLIQPTVQLQMAVGKLINSNNFLLPIESYLTNLLPLLNNAKNLSVRAFADEESISSCYVCQQLTLPFNSAWDAPNNFTSAHIQTFQITSGGAYFPSYGPMMRSDASNAGFTDALNNFDAIQFFRHLLNVKSDAGETKGVMITPLYYHNTVASPTIVTTGAGTGVGNTLMIGNNSDFIIAYSFETGCKGTYTGFNCRANGGTYDVNMTYNVSATVPNAQVYVFTEYMRVYALTVGGLIYLTLDQFRAKINDMDPRYENLLNMLLHISMA